MCSVTKFLLLQILATSAVSGFAVVNRTSIGDNKRVKSLEAFQDLTIERGSNSIKSSSQIHFNQDFVNFTKHNIKRRSSREMQIPQYMMDLYKHLSNKRWSPKFDTARSYSIVDSRVPEYFDQSWSSDSSQDGNNLDMRTITFNISYFPHDELVLMAQLRFYVIPQRPLQFLDGDSPSLVVYSPEGNVKKILFKRSLEPQGDYWETFDITHIFVKWISSLNDFKQQSVNVHVQRRTGSLTSVNLEPVFENQPQILVLSKKHLENKPLEDSVASNAAEEESSLAKRYRREASDGHYLESPGQEHSEKLNILSSIHHMIVKRSEEEDEEGEEQSNYIMDELGKAPRKNKPKKRKNPCRRKSMRVTFTDIGYDQWIIAPPSYEAFECTGKCSFPMGSHLSPTKHAVIQTLMHSLEPKQIPRACCVPTKLEPISVLYIDDDGTVTYKYEYDEMVVSECGCR